MVIAAKVKRKQTILCKEKRIHNWEKSCCKNEERHMKLVK